MLVKLHWLRKSDFFLMIDVSQIALQYGLEQKLFTTMIMECNFQKNTKK